MAEPTLAEVYDFARQELVRSAEWNEGEPCWCPLWWWDEQTGPTEGEHTDECDQKRALLDYVVVGLVSEGDGKGLSALDLLEPAGKDVKTTGGRPKRARPMKKSRPGSEGENV